MKQDYLAYKRKRLTEMPEIEKPSGGKRKYFVLAVVVFVAFFILTIVVLNGIFASRVDIEYGKMNATDEPYALNDDSVVSGETDKKYTIDARLKQLQIEETTPTIPQKEKDAKILSAQSVKIGNQNTKTQEKENLEPQEEQKIVYSKVLLGRYSSFEEAKAAQVKLRQNSGVEAFVRRMGSVYALQVGSYMNQDQAQHVAEQFSNMDYQVWILED